MVSNYNILSKIFTVFNIIWRGVLRALNSGCGAFALGHLRKGGRARRKAAAWQAMTGRTGVRGKFE
jgi:hypothetical protein